MLIDGKPTGYYTKECSAIADSGTSLLAGPPTVFTMISHAIGASRVTSKECKTIVAECGQTILGLLLSEVQPRKICSQIGLCIFYGIRGINLGIESAVDKNERK